MNAKFFQIGSTTASDLPFSQDEVSSLLLADWLPNLPLSTGVSFFGWPAQVLYGTGGHGTSYVTIHRWLGRSERQWKSVVSWMLGVAGARKVLSELGYRWVAPASAFYPETTEPMTISWPNNFPETTLTVTEDPSNPSRLRPDYIALKPVNSGTSYELCAAEAKGTGKAISSSTHNACPTAWHDQVRNLQVRFRGTIAYIPRHIVIATRVNPNAVRDATRQLVIRAWNSEKPDLNRELKPVDAVAIVLAHLFGFYQNIGASETAAALATTVERVCDSSVDRQELFDFQQAESGINEFPSSTDILMGRGVSATVRLSAPLEKLTRQLIIAKNLEEAAATISSADAQLDQWNQEALISGDNVCRLSFGVEIEMHSS